MSDTAHEATMKNAAALLREEIARAVHCPRRRCEARPGQPCRSRDKSAHEERVDKGEAVARLRELLPPGSTVYTVLRHVARSGMSRRIDFYAILQFEPRPVFCLTGLIARAMGYAQHDRSGALIVGGCGMDMGYAVVHNLSYVLHGMQSKGKGIEKAEQGRPLRHEDTDPANYRAGYSLHHDWI